MKISHYKVRILLLTKTLTFVKFLLKIKNIFKIVFYDFLYYKILLKRALLPLYGVYKKFIRDIEFNNDLKYGVFGRISAVLLSKKFVSFFILIFVFYIVVADNIRVDSIYDKELKINNSIFFVLAGVENKVDSPVVDNIPASLINIENTGYLSQYDSVVDVKPNEYIVDDPEDITYFALNYSSVFKPNILNITDDNGTTSDGTINTPQYKTKFIYVVKNGDSINSIAGKFGISAATIMWENKLTLTSIIKPGMKLSILPITGLSYKVEYGDTLIQISKQYDVSIDSIREYNSIRGDILRLGQNLIIPTGIIPKYSPTRTIVQRTTSVVSKVVSKLYPKVSPMTGDSDDVKPHIFPYGQCTWYVATRRFVPWSGHAKQWLKNSQQFGYRVGKVPAVGAIVATKEDAVYGHVAYVEEVTSDSIVISEMNYKGLGIYSKRTLKINDWRILGYIY